MEAKRIARRSTSPWADRRTVGPRESTSVRTTVVVPTLKRGPGTALCRSTRARRRFSVVLRRAHPSGWGTMSRPPTSFALSLSTEPHGRLVRHDECPTARDQPHGPLRYPPPCELHDRLRQQLVLHFEHARGKRVRSGAPVAAAGGRGARTVGGTGGARAAGRERWGIRRGGPTFREVRCSGIERKMSGAATLFPILKDGPGAAQR